MASLTDRRVFCGETGRGRGGIRSFLCKTSVGQWQEKNNKNREKWELSQGNKNKNKNPTVARVGDDLHFGEKRVVTLMVG